MEKPLIALSMRSRQDYDLVKSHIDLKLNTYSKELQVIMGKVGEYYARDPDAPTVSPDVLMAQIGETLRSDKLVSRLGAMVSESLSENSSDANVRAVILMAKQQEVADKLAAALTSDASKSEKVDALIEELQKLRGMTQLEEIQESGLEVFHNVNLETLMTKYYDPDNIIMVYPSSLNDKLDGGAHKGHHIVAFGPTESGKTALSINASAGFARQGKRVLYLINEDTADDIIIRHACNLSGMTKHQVRDNPHKAQELAANHGWENIIVLSAAPGTPNQIRSFIERYDPDCLIVDQLRNLAMKADNRVNQLEAAATAVRNISKEANVLTISVTQAGDSAKDKLVLDTGDVDYSNVGIPGQADVMVGVGLNAQYDAEGLRVLSLPKNKISGDHSHFPVRIYPQYSRIVSV
jgi:archaellum biogenesis ATPase FlaH